MLLILAALAATPAAARQPAFDEWQAVQESLSCVHPRLRSRWLNEHGLELPGINVPLPEAPSSDSGGLRLVGKFGRGPSVEVAGRDSFVFLSLGSEVAIINMADPENPEVLSEPQAMGLVTQAAVRDSFLYIGCMTGQAGIEVWNIEDPSSPVFRSRTLSLLSDFCINDTFLYLTQSNSGLNDTFKVYSTADPENVRLLGTCRDSGDVVTYTSNTVFLGDRWGLYAIDVSNPANPHRVGGFGIEPISVEARGSICCATAYISSPGNLAFDVLDVSNPAAIFRLGRLTDAGGYDMHLADTLAFLSGYYTGGHNFRIVNIADSTAPVELGSCQPPDDRYNYGVWANSSAGLACVANRYGGLALLDISDITNPVVDASILAGGSARDVCVDGMSAYVAASGLGMAILDVTTPAMPRQLGTIDSASTLSCYTVVARDSFAYMHFSVSALDLRTIDVSDPSRPVSAGGYNVPNWPEDMVLRDTFLYVAEAYALQVFNVARPREPELVGSCNLPGYSGRMDLQDTIAYVTNTLFSLVNVADPTHPVVVGNYGARIQGVKAVDTIMYGTAPYTGLLALSVADPSSPYALDSLHLTDTLWWNDVVVVGSLAYVGGERIWAVDVSDPRELRRVPEVSWTPPYLIEQMVYVEPYIYASCLDAGVCILEAESVGVAEGGLGYQDLRATRVWPTVVSTRLQVDLGGQSGEGWRWKVSDVCGRLVRRGVISARGTSACDVDVQGLPSGVYVIEVGAADGRRVRGKFVKQ